ncbi:glycoside hydrolase family 127 protein [Blautia sp. AF13-16]|nr:MULTISPECIES: beta-L-arabinofuranosidase domain-containing protein [unclassified Blautia]MCJ7844006.1 glycoside hydrolase family 127 protein [Blautia sp. NSJ-175]RHS18188.1 glycoside hydrolase family 127 protein [Blautia sp. AF13-16]
MRMGKLDSPKLSDVKIEDRFWSRYIKLVREKMLPYQWEVLNDRVNDAAKSHCIENFKIAAKESTGKYYGMVFQDTDVAKWLEALAYSLEGEKNGELEKEADEVIDLIGRAQQQDGYLDTYYTIQEPLGRWSNLREGHELYTAGHMIEAAAAYYQATGKDSFLKIVCRLADCICDTFGPDEGKIHGCPGHPEIELALVKLYRLTKDEKYLNMAKYFLDIRGSQSPSHFEEEQKMDGFHHIFPEFEHLGYNNIQAHKPIRKQKKADGHAVRALYLYSAMADVGYECRDESLLDACRILFDNITGAQMFITGSVGAAADGECFTCDYDLPNNYNYSETCASVALAMFSLRMFQVERDGKYMDIAERALYNTVLGGMSLNGTEFFYVNPLEVVPEQLKANRTLHHVLPSRRKWLGVACCPPNIARTLTGLGNYIYSENEDTLFVNLFIAGKCSVKLKEGTISVSVQTDYPYDGKVKITVENHEGIPFSLAVREPGWTKVEQMISKSGKEVSVRREKGYLYTEKTVWESQAEFIFEIPLKPVLMCAHPRVASDAGKAAIVRGPLVYCLEEADNGKNLGAVVLDAGGSIEPVFQEDLLGGTTAVLADAWRVSEKGWEGKLYQPVTERLEKCRVKAVPYCMWNNRGEGEMRVWLRVRE